MGQMTFGILYGVQAEPPAQHEDGWYDLTEQYQDGTKPGIPGGDGPRDFLGYWVAVGGSGKEGIAYLSDPPFAVDELTEHPAYRDYCVTAQEQWEVFAKWAVTKKQHFPQAKFYLVATETA